jgi:hypothetical protein
MRQEEQNFDMHIEIFQPWSTFVMKTRLPPVVLEKMIKITDKIIEDAENGILETPSGLHIDIGNKLSGQINQGEFAVDHEILLRENLMTFFLDVTKKFIIEQSIQSKVHEEQRKEILSDEWATSMLSVWIVSQKDNEYNPIHTHTDCHVSAIMYLKIPEFLPDRKIHDKTDGKISFSNNASRDPMWGAPAFTMLPKPGDFYIFPATQIHQVYPFRTADGKGERRSVSFNALFTSKSMMEMEDKSRTRLKEQGIEIKDRMHSRLEKPQETEMRQ